MYICQTKPHNYYESKSITYCKRSYYHITSFGLSISRKTLRFFRYNISRYPTKRHFLAERLKEILEKEYQTPEIQLGYLDITFFRDDFRRTDKPLEANKTKIDFIVENKKVIFIDDVLFTGRSIRSALTAIQSFGRPSEIELLVLIDRRFSRNLPIQPDYRGRQVDAINNEKVKVSWKENEGEDGVYLITS